MRQNGIRPARFRFKVGGRVGKMGGGKMISGKARKDEASGFYSPDMGMKSGQMYKKGGAVKKVGKKKQGYKDRKDESIAMRIKKKRTPAQLKACLLYTSDAADE